MTWGQGRIALVVEDDPLVRMMAVEALSDAGLSVLEASDADEALAVLALAPRIDLLFTDVRMPGGRDGVQLTWAARMAKPGLKAIITSGFSGYESAGPSPIRGVTFLPKPYTAGQLIDAAREELLRPPAASPGREGPAPGDRSTE
jgi:DNA-binding NtrC family response regulator